jgi:hypothetical protein
VHANVESLSDSPFVGQPVTNLVRDYLDHRDSGIIGIPFVNTIFEVSKPGRSSGGRNKYIDRRTRKILELTAKTSTS